MSEERYLCTASIELDAVSLRDAADKAATMLADGVWLVEVRQASGDGHYTVRPWQRAPYEDIETQAVGMFPYGQPVEEARLARRAAVKLLWDKREMLSEHSEEIVDDVLTAALPHLRFYPLGDNHHNAAACPYCTQRKD